MSEISTLTTGEGLVKVLSIKVPKEEVDKAFQTEITAMGSNAEIKGFRKGKAPSSMIQSLYGDKASEKAINSLVNSFYEKALTDHSLKPAGYAKIDLDQSTDFSDGFTFKAEVEVQPEFEVCSVDGVSIEKPVYTVQESDITNVLDGFKEKSVEFKAITEARAIASGDHVEFDFDGFVDGEPLPQGSAKNFKLEIGGGSFIPGFEEGMLGLNIGDEKDVEVSFPEAYHEKSIAGKPAIFKVKINQILEKSYPEMNDEWAKTMSFDSFDAMKEDIKANIEKDYLTKADVDFKKNIRTYLVNNTDFAVPSSQLEEQIQNMKKQSETELLQQGYPKDKMDEYHEKWDEHYKKESLNSVKTSYIFLNLAKDFGVEPTSADIEKKIEDYATRLSIPLERVQEIYQAPERRSSLFYQVLEDNVFAQLKSKVKEVIVEARVEDEKA